MQQLSVSRIWIYFSYLICLLTAAASLLGIFFPPLYSQETPNWALQGRGQDTGNLIAVPFLLLSSLFLTKKSLKAFFVWLGTLFYYTYAYMVYSFGLHFNFLFLIYVSILGLCAYSLMGSFVNLDLQKLASRVTVNSSTKTASRILIAIAVLFGLLWLSDIVPAIMSGNPPQSLSGSGLFVNPIHVIDLSLVLPAMFLAGLLFLKGSRIGAVFAAPWLTFSVLMGTSIIVTLILMVQGGDTSALVPLIMTGLVVLSGLFGLLLFLRQIKEK